MANLRTLAWGAVRDSARILPRHPDAFGGRPTASSSSRRPRRVDSARFEKFAPSRRPRRLDSASFEKLPPWLALGQTLLAAFKRRAKRRIDFQRGAIRRR